MAKSNPEKDNNSIFKVTYEKRGDYLYVFMSGQEDNLKESLKTWAAISKKCKQLGYKKVLIEEDVGTVLSITEMYSFSSELPKIGFTGIKIAFVDRHLEQLSENLFAETVAVNQGINGKVFQSFEEAEKWLISK